MKIEPFHVRFVIGTAMRLPTHGIPLDSLLAFAAVEEATEMGHDTPLDAIHDLGLERYVADDGRWCHKASVLTLAAAQDTYNAQMTRPALVREYAGALDAGLISGRMDILSLGTGRYKAYLFSHPMGTCASAEAWGVGNVERVRALASRIRSIGKLSRLGAGIVISQQIDLDDSAHTRWRNRAIPATNPVPGSALMQCGYQAPYWDTRLHGMCAVPPATYGA